MFFLNNSKLQIRHITSWESIQTPLCLLYGHELTRMAPLLRETCEKSRIINQRISKSLLETRNARDNYPEQLFDQTDIHLRVGRHKQSFERTRLIEEGEITVLFRSLERSTKTSQSLMSYQSKLLSLLRAGSKPLNLPDPVLLSLNALQFLLFSLLDMLNGSLCLTVTKNFRQTRNKRLLFHRSQSCRPWFG